MTPHRHTLAKATRPLIAIATAYALALQMLLLSVIASGAAMTATADGSVICIGGKTVDGRDQPSHSPAGFAECTLACVQGFGANAILPDGVTPVPIGAIATTLVQIPAAAFVLAAHPSPKLSQGPPHFA